MLNPSTKQFIIEQTGSSEISKLEELQSLWSGYGTIVKVHLSGGDLNSVVVKNISLPDDVKHPRGWNTNRSHIRKINSYKVEMHWYQNWSQTNPQSCRIPKHLGSRTSHSGDIIILEDIDDAGFPVRKNWLTKQETLPCINWLANFHAQHLNEEPTGLWPIGTYWHLDTRPDELASMAEGPLKNTAVAIDEKLNQCHYKTLVHGDAKVANFCFSENGDQVAAVDFQYIGAGCGMKDFIYFLGSCLDEAQCEEWAEELLDYYFIQLRNSIADNPQKVDVDELEREWRELFPFAWTDFYRFLKGWMPGHSKINRYSDRLAQIALETL